MLELIGLSIFIAIAVGLGLLFLAYILSGRWLRSPSRQPSATSSRSIVGSSASWLVVSTSSRTEGSARGDRPPDPSRTPGSSGT
jgi:hypothetical protein